MRKIYASFFQYALAMIVLGVTSIQSSAVVVTINATGTTGSYRTGSVSSGGTKNDGDMITINSSSNRGFASFDLSTIPAGAVINSVSVVFTTYSSSSSTANNNIYGFTGDPSTIAGATLYTNAGSGTSFNSSSWTANAANTKALNAAGITFIQNNAGNAFVNLGFVRGSTNTYNIYGYTGTSAQQPQLTIDYAPPVACSGPISPITIASTTTTACVSVAFNITSSGVTPGTSGVSYQWQTSAPGANIFSDVATGGTSSTLAITSQTTATDYRLRVTCTNTNDITYSNVFAIGQNPFYNCYCTPVSTCTNEGIDSVNFNSGAIINKSAFCVGTGYSDYSSLGSSAAVTQAQVVPISVTAHINSNPASAGVWIDYDHSGTFDTTEYTSLGSATVTIPSGGTKYTFTGNIQISPTAMTGITRMRIRSANQNGIAKNSSCITSSAFGEIEDYLITINAGTACSGTPTAGAISTAPTSVCPNTNFTLTAAGFTNGVTGLTYEWQMYDMGTTTWVPAPGTNNTFTYTGNISTATDFRFVVTCANGSGTDATNPVTVGINPFTQCYCTPATTSSNYYINNFSTTNALQNISNLTSGYSTAGYGDFTGSDTVAILENGSFDFSLNHGSSTTYTFGTKIWIDWNQNGLFTDAGEQLFASTGYASSFSGTITAPAGALTGFTRMRVGSNYNSSTGPATPCTNFANGEYEDYTINVIALIPCSGTPVAGTATGPQAVCTGASFTLQANGFTTGSGLTIQWEESPSGSGVWTAITNATNPNHTISTGISSATDYHYIITCSNGGGNDISNTLSISINPFYNCYCTPASGCTNEGIENVTFDVINNNSTFCTNTSGYSDFAGLGANATVTQGQNVAISVTGHINSNPATVGVWIDYDQSGTFDTTEYTLIGSTNGISPLPSTQIYTNNILIPVNAMTGITRMRVRSANQGGIAKTSACTNSGVYGEYEDYLINITAANNCAGTPTAGTVNGPGPICPNTAFTLNTTGTTNGVLGLTYQWEYLNPNTFTWDPAPGTNNNATYTVAAGITTSTDYRLQITCTNGGGFDFSAPFTVVLNPPTQCYCIPTYVTNNTVDVITNVQLGGLTNSSGQSTNPPNYSDYTSLQPGTLAIPDLSQGLTHNLSVTFGTDGTQYSMVWIDFDQNGVFDTSEAFSNGTSVGGSATATIPILVPTTATLGNTRMRIRGGDDSQPSKTQACGASNSNYGEGEDYLVNIISAPACLPPTSLTAANVTASSADVSWTGIASAAGYEWAVDNTSTPAPGATTTINTTQGVGPFPVNNLVGSTIHYLHVRTDCGGSNYSPWSIISFTTLLSNDLPSGALPLTINAPCATYSNATATYSTNEPAVSCRGGNINQGALVWFKFVAPQNGFVRVSTDGASTNLDTKLGLFTTSNPSDPTDLASFSIIACDDDNGLTYGTASTLYASGLTPGATYYVGVDQYNGTSTGSFCMSVDSVTPTMISPSGTCAGTAETPYSREDYTGWATLIDDQGRLIANTRRTTAGGSNTVYNYTASLTVNTSAVRQSGTQFYLDRNFLLGYGQATPATTFDVKLYFLNAELAALQAVDASATLSNLNVTHQTGATCYATYTSTNGTNSVLAQTGNGTASNISWIQVNTPGFSNFYIMSGPFALSIKLGEITATNVGNRNRVDWNTESELKSDVFELERSFDGTNFRKLATIAAKGEASNYSYWDETPANGLNHYRLKMTDAAGKVNYSKTVTAFVKGNGSFTVEAYPNPVSNILTVVAKGAASDATITITDITGKVVRTITAVKGFAEIDVKTLIPGMYLVKYMDGEHTKTIKINKQ